MAIPTNEEKWSMLERFDSKMTRLLYPRIYDIPGNFGSPKKVAVDLGFSLLAVRKQSPSYLRNALEDRALCAAVTGGKRAIRFGMPTYFIEKDFLEAALQTQAPAEMPIAELRFPMPAMVMMFPKGLIKTPQDGPIEYLLVAKGEIGLQSKIFADEEDFILRENSIFYYTQAQTAGFGGKVDIPEDGQIQDIFKEQAEGDNYSYQSMDEGVGKGVAPSTPLDDAETIFNQEMFAAAIKLLLAMTARPELVTSGSERKPAREKKGEWQRAFWTPNFIGRGYRIQREETGEGGTHATPRMHWRRGHYRRQHFGTGRTQVKTLWIDPMLVAAAASEKEVEGSKTDTPAS